MVSAVQIFFLQVLLVFCQSNLTFLFLSVTSGLHLIIISLYIHESLLIVVFDNDPTSSSALDGLVLCGEVVYPNQGNNPVSCTLVFPLFCLFGVAELASAFFLYNIVDLATLKFCAVILIYVSLSYFGCFSLMMASYMCIAICL